MARRLRLLVLAALMIAGCQPLALRETAVAGARSILLVQLQASALPASRLGVFDAFAATPAGDLPFRIVSRSPDTARYLVYFSQSLEELGLEEGSYDMAPTPCASRGLPAVLGVRKLDLEDADRLLTEQEIPESFVPIRVPAETALSQDPASQFEFFGPTRTISFQGERREVFVQVEDQLFEIDLDGLSAGQLLSQTSTIPAPVGSEFTAQFRHPSGLVMVGDSAGVLYCGRLDEGLQVLTPTSASKRSLGPIKRITGSKSPVDPFELFVATSSVAAQPNSASGPIWRLTADEPSCDLEFEMIIESQPTNVQNAEDHSGFVVWIGPGKVFAAPHDGIAVIWEEGSEPLRLDVAGPTSDAVYIEGTGLFTFDRNLSSASGTQVQLYDLVNEAPVYLVREPSPVAPRRAVASGRGTIISFGGRGNYSEFYPTRYRVPGPTWCAQSRQPIQESGVGDLVVRERELVLSTSATLPDGMGRRTTVTVIPLRTP